MHPSRLRLGPSQSRPLIDASPGSARSPGLRVCRAAPSRRRNSHTHAPFRTECQSFLRCRDARLTTSRKQRSGHAAALRRAEPQVRILSGPPARARRSPQSVVARLSDKGARVACASRLPSDRKDGRGQRCAWPLNFDSGLRPECATTGHSLTVWRKGANRPVAALGAGFAFRTRKLAAILAADIVGFSRLTDADEDRTLASRPRY